MMAELRSTKKHLASSLLVVVATLFASVATSFFMSSSEFAHAAADPCQAQVNAVSRAERNVVSQQSFLDRTVNNALNVENQVNLQIANLQGQVAQAEANVNAAGATATGNVGGCVITGLFGFGRIAPCVGRGVASGVSQKARAQATANAARARLQSYSTYGANRIRREQQRIVVAQDRLALAQQQLAVAVAALANCQAQNPDSTVIGGSSGNAPFPGSNPRPPQATPVRTNPVVTTPAQGAPFPGSNPRPIATPRPFATAVPVATPVQVATPVSFATPIPENNLNGVQPTPFGY